LAAAAGFLHQVRWRKIEVRILGASSSNKSLSFHLHKIQFSLRLLAGRGGEGDEERSLDMVGCGGTCIRRVLTLRSMQRFINTGVE
jgi:hypothetical protein